MTSISSTNNTNNSKTIDRKALLIQNIRDHPELYKQDVMRAHNIQRADKQRIWDMIAKRSGFVKTEDAKCKWRSLIIYLRQHLENVARRKIRRYTPNTQNPEDKYVQLTDWRYYEDMKFIVPYIKTIYGGCRQPPQRAAPSKATNSTDASASTLSQRTSGLALHNNNNNKEPFTEPMKFQIGNVIVEVEVDNKSQDMPPKSPALLSNQQEQQQRPVITGAQPPLEESESTPFEELSVNDQNLKAFFDAMLRSTQRLPRFHQKRVKHKLLNAIQEQKSRTINI